MKVGYKVRLLIKIQPIHFPKWNMYRLYTYTERMLSKNKDGNAC